MKKLFRIVNISLENNKRKYFIYFILLFLSVLFMILSTFLSKVLVDTLNGDINNLEEAGWLEIAIAQMFGGVDFLIKNLWFFSIIIIGIAIAAGLLSFARLYLRAVISPAIEENLQLKVFNHLEKLPFATIKKNKNGDLIQTCTRDEQSIREFIVNQMHMIIYTFFIVLISFLLLLSINWQIACISIIILPIMFIYSFFIIKGVRTRYRLVDDSEGLMTAKIEENLSSVRVVKAFNNETYEINEFEKKITDYKKKFISWRKMSSFFFSSSDIFVFGQILLTTLFGIYLAYTQQISAGTLVISFTFVNMMVWPVRDVATILSNFAKTLASADRLNIILEEPIEDLISGEKPEIKGEVVFDHVSFHYDDADVAVLNDISFKTEPGQTIAIMGKTGSGKSTLSLLITRLYEYTSGSIKIDGVELNTISKEHIRKNVASVLQEPFLFSKTILNNIKVANKKATINDVERAAKIADIHDNIVEFKQGYETPVGEKGVTLSGGQKQRLAIARTIVNNAPILIFDDSLSAVDTETDLKIRRALKEKQGNATTFIITHRVATAKDADMIIVLEDGKISQKGTHEELVNQSGLYKRVFDIQTKMK